MPLAGDHGGGDSGSHKHQPACAPSGPSARPGRVAALRRRLSFAAVAQARLLRSVHATTSEILVLIAAIAGLLVVAVVIDRIDKSFGLDHRYDAVGFVENSAALFCGVLGCAAIAGVILAGGRVLRGEVKRRRI